MGLFASVKVLLEVLLGPLEGSLLSGTFKGLLGQLEGLLDPSEGLLGSSEGIPVSSGDLLVHAENILGF